ncbi:hypothetical protein OSTOST_21217 [Ostertagia ostertagi]
MDVLRQNLHSGKLFSERIIQSHFQIPSWATKLRRTQSQRYYVVVLLNESTDDDERTKHTTHCEFGPLKCVGWLGKPGTRAAPGDGAKETAPEALRSLGTRAIPG